MATIKARLLATGTSNELSKQSETLRRGVETMLSPISAA